MVGRACAPWQSLWERDARQRRCVREAPEPLPLHAVRARGSTGCGGGGEEEEGWRDGGGGGGGMHHGVKAVSALCRTGSSAA